VESVRRAMSYAKGGVDSSDDDADLEECGTLGHLADEGFSISIGNNTFGAAILAVAQWSDADYVRTHGRLQAAGRLLNGLGLFAASTLIQATLVCFVLLFSDERMQDPYQVEKPGVMAAALRDARATNTTLPKNDIAHRLCLHDHSLPYSQTIVVFVWLCKSSPEILHSLWSLYLLASLPYTQHSSVQLSGGQLQIVRLPTYFKWLVCVFVNTPTLIIGITLTAAGMDFLMYCSALGVLILKAMALSYIATIPSVLFAGLGSKELAMEVSKTMLVGTTKKCNIWDSWMSGVAKVVLHAAIACWYCRVLHAELTSFRWECFLYKHQFVFPLCHHCGLHFFGLHLAN